MSTSQRVDAANLPHCVNSIDSINSIITLSLRSEGGLDGFRPHSLSSGVEDSPNNVKELGDSRPARASEQFAILGIPPLDQT